MSSAIDNMGFITLDELQDAFTYEMDEIERDIAVNGMPSNPRVLIEWVDGLRMQCLKRARGNLKDYLRNNPHVRQEVRQERELKDVTDSRRDYMDRVKANRERAMMGYEPSGS